jgi:hypothetical protein
MYTILKYANGRMVDGLILSASADSIRVILRQQGDTAVLRRVFGELRAEDGSPVEMESMVSGDYTNLSCFGNSETQQKVQAAN